VLYCILKQTETLLVGGLCLNSERKVKISEINCRTFR